jgi:hypothetical protein
MAQDELTQIRTILKRVAGLSPQGREYLMSRINEVQPIPKSEALQDRLPSSM